MMRRAQKRFAPYPDRYFGFDLAAQREELRRWLDRLARGEAAPEGEPAPHWRFDLP
jgi:hypothetical protein